MTTTEQMQTEPATESAPDKLKARSADFAEATQTGSESGENLDLLLDIQMTATVVLGKARVPFKRLLQLSPGSVLKLDKSVGQVAELYVQDILLATGDIVVVNDRYGIRIRDVMGAESVQRTHGSAAGEPQENSNA